MNYITTTNLRTESRKLVESLKKGKKISLVHRSHIIGEISPVEKDVKIFDIKKFQAFIKGSKLNNTLSYSQREKLYRNHLEEKYGKNLP